MTRSMEQSTLNNSEEQTRKGMQASIAEGCTFGLWSGALGGNFLTGMALHLGAGGAALGFLGALPSLSTMMQLFSAPFVVGLKKRRAFLALFSGTQRISGALAGLLALWLLPSPLALILFVALQALAWIAMAPSTVVWQGYMTDLVPREMRGRYFATRNSWGALISMLGILLYGQILDRWPGTQGFRLLYLIALAVAGVNLIFWFRHPELPQGDEASGRPFWESVRIPLTRPGPHLTATWFFAAWGFAQGMAAPFFPVALVQYLGLSFTTVSLLATVASITSILTVPLWGRWQDRVGQLKAIGLLTGMLALVPPLFLLGRYLGWAPLVIAHMLHGTAGAGLGLANQTLNLQLAPTRDRTSYFAFFAAAGGITGFLTPLVAGPLTVDYLELLFWGSAILSAALSLLWRIRVEPRLTTQVRSL